MKHLSVSIITLSILAATASLSAQSTNCSNTICATATRCKGKSGFRCVHDAGSCFNDRCTPRRPNQNVVQQGSMFVLETRSADS